MRIRLLVSYDGTDFRGWAAQRGQRTVQDTIRQAILRVSGEDVEVVGASRTDSGAHAKGQACHFDTTVPIEPAKWARVLNKVLDPDLAVTRSGRVGDDFHSRFSAIDRYYRYRIHTGTRDPLRSRVVHNVWHDLDFGKMRQAAQYLVGEHDFLAFTEELDPGVENTRRTLFSVEVKNHRDEVWIDIVGTAFLRGMMRRMSGALLEVGRGHRPAEEVARLLTEQREELQWPVVLPAKGLCLMHVRYGRRPRDNRRPPSTP
jgi:tRNA pseudouridine38-40 synthase